MQKILMVRSQEMTDDKIRDELQNLDRQIRMNNKMREF